MKCSFSSTVTRHRNIYQGEVHEVTESNVEACTRGSRLCSNDPGGALTLAAPSPAGATTDGIILTVDTSAIGGTGTTVSLPLYGNGLDATVDWGDGSSAVTDAAPGNLSYTYAAPGTYTITVTGNVPEFGTQRAQRPSLTMHLPQPRTGMV